MGDPLPRPADLAARLETPIEEWPYLKSEVLLRIRSRKVCMTFHWFRHRAGVITASSMAGLLSEHHCCNKWIRSIVASGYGGRPPFLLVLG